VTGRASRLSLVALGVLASATPATAQCPDGTPPPCAAQRPAPAPNSVAVLTFENVARDTSAQYLAEGLADQIATRLGGVARLTVVSRSAVRRLHSPEQQSLQQLGLTLNAAYLVSGAIRAASGRVRVNVEAVRAATGEAVWSDAYDRAGDDLIGIEEAVATEVAAGIGGRLSPQERRALGSRATANSAAYEQFLRGNVLLARRTLPSIQGAITAYQAATESDPEFADAYGRLAYAYAVGTTLLPAEAPDALLDSLLTLARRAASRGMQRNIRSSDVWMGRAYTLATWFFWFMGTPARTDADDSLLASLGAFRHAVELNPRNDEAWHQYGATLSFVDDSAALVALRRALALEPARAVTYADLSWTYARMGRMDRAEATLDSGLALEPELPVSYFHTLYRWAAGDTTGAVAEARRAPEQDVEVLAVLAHDSAAIRVMDSLVAHPRFCGDATSYLLWTGRRAQSVQALLRCTPSIVTRYRLRWPTLAPLADDPRIRALRTACDSIARTRWR
jgi:TolB-like protein